MSGLQRLLFTGIALTTLILSGCAKFPPTLKNDVEEEINGILRKRGTYVFTSGFSGDRLFGSDRRLYILNSVSTGIKDKNHLKMTIRARKIKPNMGYCKGDTSYYFDIISTVDPLKVYSINERDISIEN